MKSTWFFYLVGAIICVGALGLCYVGATLIGPEAPDGPGCLVFVVEGEVVAWEPSDDTKAKIDSMEELREFILKVE